MSRPAVLLVDDDDDFRSRFEVLGARHFSVRSAPNWSAAAVSLAASEPDVILLDVDLGGGESGLEILGSLRRTHPGIPVIMVSDDDSASTIVSAMQLGAVDYFPKRLRLEVLGIKLNGFLESGAWKEHARRLQGAVAGRIVGDSPAMREVRRQIRDVADREVRVMIRGETGTGKELVAGEIHAAGRRSDERLVVISGNTGTDDLFDAEVFGHEKGAFTGADRRRLGKLELAHNGTLFLDEVGKVPVTRQAKLLRAIDGLPFARLGGADDISVDFRLITASNENLEEAVQGGRFLPDFYYRIREYELVVPPLRERLSDIPLLTRHLLERFGERGATLEVDDAVVEPLFDYAWPGNVRELGSVLKQAAIQARGAALTADLLRCVLQSWAVPQNAMLLPVATPDSPQASRSVSRLDDYLGSDYAANRNRLLNDFDREFVQRELDRCAGNVARAARRMGLSRATMYRRIEELGLEIPGREEG